MRATSQEDYLIRLIQQIIQMLVRIVRLKKAGEFAEALTEVDHATLLLLGPAADTLMLLDASTAAQLIGDPDRVLTLATLLSEQAEIHLLRGDVPDAENASKRALALAYEAARLGVSDPGAAESLIEALLKTI